MAAPNRPVGEMPCEHNECGRPVVVKETGAGKLSYDCLYCSGHGYADKGGPRFRAWRTKLKAIPGHEPDDTPPADPPAPPQPKPASTGFSLGNL